MKETTQNITMPAIEEVFELDMPVLRGKQEINAVVVRKHQSGALRGTRLQALMDMNAMMTVLPRVAARSS